MTDQEAAEALEVMRRWLQDTREATENAKAVKQQVLERVRFVRRLIARHLGQHQAIDEAGLLLQEIDEKLAEIVDG